MQRTWNRTLIALATLALAAPPVAAQGVWNARVELEARYWTPDLTSTVRVAEGGVGTDIDLVDDLGMGDEGFLEGRLSWRPTPRSKIRLAWVPLSYSGDRVVSRTLEFGGETFRVNTRVVSDLDIEYARLGWAWQFIGTKDGNFLLGPVLEAKAFRVEASLAAPEFILPLSASETFEEVFPAGGLMLDARLGRRALLFAEATIMPANEFGELLDWEVGVKFRPVGGLLLTAGYRALEADAEDDDDRLDLDISGAFFGLSWRF